MESVTVESVRVECRRVESLRVHGVFSSQIPVNYRM